MNLDTVALMRLWFGLLLLALLSCKNEPAPESKPALNPGSDRRVSRPEPVRAQGEAPGPPDVHSKFAIAVGENCAARFEPNTKSVIVSIFEPVEGEARTARSEALR